MLAVFRGGKKKKQMNSAVIKMASQSSNLILDHGEQEKVMLMMAAFSIQKMFRVNEILGRNLEE